MYRISKHVKTTDAKTGSDAVAFYIKDRKGTPYNFALAVEGTVARREWTIYYNARTFKRVGNDDAFEVGTECVDILKLQYGAIHVQSVVPSDSQLF